MRRLLRTVVLSAGVLGAVSQAQAAEQGSAEVSAEQREVWAKEILEGREPGFPDLFLARAGEELEQLKRPPAQRKGRFSDEARLYRVRRWLQGLHQNSKYRAQAIEIWVQARSLAKGVPTLPKEEDEYYSKYFRRMLESFEEARRAADDGFFHWIPERVSSMELHLDNHERITLNKKQSPRGRALLKEGKELVRRYAKHAERANAAIASLEENAEYQRLRSQEAELYDDARRLQVDLGLVGFTYATACGGKTTAHKRLCELDQTLEGISKRVLAMEKRAGVPSAD